MPIGFRKSLFGFNSDDVMEYIEKTHKSYVEKETVLNEKVDELTTELNNAKSQISDILSEKETIEKELKEYTEKYDEIERLSQNIGRLYLVAETNAASIIESAMQNKEIADTEVARNIECADKTYTSLAVLDDEINKTSAEFSSKIQSLMLALQQAKSNIYANNDDATKKLNDYQELIESIKA